MKRLLSILVVTALAGGVLAMGPTGAAGGGPAYTAFIACDYRANVKPRPARVCPRGKKVGAFFRSNKADVFFKACVRFPTGRRLCVSRQEAVKGQLYVNRITTNIVGVHKVTWFVKGKRVALRYFRRT